MVVVIAGQWAGGWLSVSSDDGAYDEDNCPC